MSTFSTCTSIARPSSPNDGDVLFETDTKNIIIWDGSAWRGYQNDGTFASYVYSTNTHSASFDGSNDTITLGSNVPILSSATTFSVSLWVRPVSGFGILSSGTSTSTLFDITWQSSVIRMRMGGTSGGRTLDTSGTLSTNTWYHYTFTFNNQSAKCYLDGTLSNSKTITPTSTTSTTGTNLTLGELIWTGGFYYQGHTDEVALFDYELSATQVSNIYNNKAYNNPYAVWRLENNANDEFGNLNGTNNGATFDSSEKPY